MNNNDEIKKILDEPPVPKELSPESVKNRLDSIKADKKRKSIHMGSAIKWCSGIAACAVLLSTGSFIANKIQTSNYSSSVIKGNYTTAAVNYKQVYKYMKKYMDNNMNDLKNYDMVLESAEEAGIADGFDFDRGEIITGTETTGAGRDDAENTPDISKVYDQENGVLEGDIVQTDGTYIYSSASEDSNLCIHIAKTDGIGFTDSTTLSLFEYLPQTVNYGNICSMYLQNGRLIVTADTNYSRTHVLIFEAGDELRLIGDYSQDGRYSDIRLMADGTLYIISSYNWTSLYEDGGDYKKCIPAYYTGERKCVISPDGILLPESDSSKSCEREFGASFTNIGSLNVFSDSPNTPIDFKSLAGFTGQLYCSQNNIYLAGNCWTADGISTDFTRISIENGKIIPAASTNAAGYIKDQFSMSEYNGFFRAAVSRSKVISKNYSVSNDNAVYAFDMELNKIGEIGGFGENETVQSASFQGNMAYVVTFRKTDPLYAIDLSDPYSPVILDEYKITGYSSYMQQWSENLLLGFGRDADEEGNELGLKLVMFDNSDPDNLRECGVKTLHAKDAARFNASYEYEDNWIYSSASYDRKALMISPSKNLIAFPFSCSYSSGFALYSYDSGSFTQRSIIYTNGEALRAVYINNTLFIVGNGEMAAVDIETMTENDRVYF